MKICCACKIEKSESEYYKTTNKAGLKYICKECDKEAGRKWRAANKEQHSKYMREYHLAHPRSTAETADINYPARYHITASVYHQMLADQGGVCKICKEPNVDGRRLGVDHDHKCCPAKRSCGECVRGLLCHRCNTGIGMLQDNINLLRSAIEYLSEYQCE